jgi:hypothetical protein
MGNIFKEEEVLASMAPARYAKVLLSIVRLSAWAPSEYIRRVILFGYCAGILKLLRSPGIDSPSQCSLGGRSRYFKTFKEHKNRLHFHQLFLHHIYIIKLILHNS